jgi:hypothetical protein
MESTSSRSAKSALATALWASAATALSLTTTAHAGFAVYTVGGDANCGYTSIQAAIDDAKAHPGEDYIFIAQNRTYASQQLVVTDDDVIIEGGFPDCGVFDNGSATTLISGTTDHSIFEIEGNSNVALWNMELTGASLRVDQKGGAIYFGGAGHLSLMNDWIHDNIAGYGGAFAVNPSGPTSVDMLKNLIIGPNTARVQGGAIRIEGQTTVTAGWSAGEPPIYIGGNVALGQGDSASGGGIEVVGPASFAGSVRIHDNTADYGGAFAVYAHDGDAATVNLYTTDAGNPVQLAANHAKNTGGAIYLKSSDGGAPAAACLQDFQVQQNTAQNGSAFYSDVNNGIGAVVDLNGAFSCQPPSGAVACAAEVPCNDISGNVSQDTAGNPTNGATVLVQSGGEFSGQRFAARGNHGGSLVQFIADAGLSQFAQDYVDLHDCLLADNVESGTPGTLVDASGGHAQTMVELRNCTIANNTLDAASVVHADVNTAVITDSIFAQPGKLSLDFPGDPANLTTAYVLSGETTSLGNGTGIEQGTPSFVDATNGDYHLVRTSAGVDVAPFQDGVDLDGGNRSIDLSDIENDFGPTDLGAYEIPTQLPPASCSTADTIFCDGFELP